MIVKPQITVIGVGYVGLVAAASFAAHGTQVIAVDTNSDKIANLEKDILPISETGLSELLAQAKKQKTIRFTTDLESAIATSNIVVIAVGTPFDVDTGETDLSSLYAAADKVINLATNKTLIVNKSTAPIGTVNKLNKIIRERGKEGVISAVANPEFLSQGSAVKDFNQAKRVVIGAEENCDIKILIDIYSSFIEREKIVVTTPDTAEIAKYSANSMLASRVAFINEVAQIADHYHADIKDISYILGLDPRIGKEFLNAGPGYGGSCFPKDLKALNKSFLDLNLDLPLLSSINTSNISTISYLTNKLKKVLEECDVKKLTIWGVSFKAETDDVRDAQPIRIISSLLADGKYEICCFDKIAEANAKLILGDQVSFADDATSSLQDSELLCILTEWNEFRNYPLAKIKEQMKKANIVDFRNIVSMQEAKKIGINLVNFANPK